MRKEILFEKKIMHRRFVIIIPHHHDKKKLLREFNKIHYRHATYIAACLKWYKIQIKRRLRKIFLPEFNKCNFLFLTNVQETFVKLIKVFELNKTILYLVSIYNKLFHS